MSKLLFTNQEWVNTLEKNEKLSLKQLRTGLLKYKLPIKPKSQKCQIKFNPPFSLLSPVVRHFLCLPIPGI